MRKLTAAVLVTASLLALSGCAALQSELNSKGLGNQTQKELFTELPDGVTAEMSGNKSGFRQENSVHVSVPDASYVTPELLTQVLEDSCAAPFDTLSVSFFDESKPEKEQQVELQTVLNTLNPGSAPNPTTSYFTTHDRICN